MEQVEHAIKLSSPFGVVERQARDMGSRAGRGRNESYIWCVNLSNDVISYHDT
jgi:hypothetical protein